MLAPTIIDFSAAKVGTCGTDKSVFSVAFLRRANTVIASARPGTTGKTITSGTGKPVPYGYRFQCRQNRDNQAINDRPYGCTAEFSTALMCGGSFPVSSVTSTPGGAGVFSVPEGDDFIIQRVGALEEKQDERLHAQHNAELPESRQEQRAERWAEHERDHRRVED